MQSTKTRGRVSRRRHAAVAQLFVITFDGLTKLVEIVRGSEARRALDARRGQSC